jgi:hypothetical protein
LKLNGSEIKGRNSNPSTRSAQKSHLNISTLTSVKKHLLLQKGSVHLEPGAKTSMQIDKGISNSKVLSIIFRIGNMSHPFIIRLQEVWTQIL